MTNNKRIDVELLEQIMVEVEKSVAHNQSASAAVMDNNNYKVGLNDSQIVFQHELCSESGLEQSWESKQLLDCFGRVLQQVWI